MNGLTIEISLLPPPRGVWTTAGNLERGTSPADCDWIALDFETATAARDSACAIGLVYVRDGRVVGTERALIQPPGNEYDGFNCMIHGIEPQMTADSPTFAEIWPVLRERLANRPLLAHNASFDFSVLRHCLDSSCIAYPEATYFCTRVFSLRHWPGLPSYALEIVADHCGIAFEHHDPAEDARAAAEIALRISRETDACDLATLAELKEVRPGRLYANGYQACSYARPRKWHGGLSAKDIATDCTEFDEGHPFFGCQVAFTGALECMPRRAAMQQVADVGGQPSDGVTKHTDYLVVGQIDFRKLREGESLSSKMKRAADLRAQGSAIEILGESDFLQLL